MDNILNYKPIVYRIAVGAMFFMQGIVFSAWACRIADIKHKLALSDADVGTVLLALPLGQLLAMGLSGYLVTRYTSRNVIKFSGVFYPSMLILLSFAASMEMLFALLMIFGVAANLNNISINTQAVSVERIYGRSIIASFHGIWSLAGFVGGLTSALLVAWHVGMRAHFIGVIAFSVILLCLIKKYLAPFDSQREPLESDLKKKPRSIWRPTPFILILGLLALGSMSCEGTMFDWSVIYFRDVLKTDPEISRVGFIAFMSAMAAGRFCGDYLITRFGHILLLQASGLIINGGLLITVVFPHPVAAALGFLLVGLGVSSIVPTCYSLAGRSRRISSGMAIATVATIGFFGFLAGPPFIGYIAHASSLRLSFALMSIMGIMVTLIAPTIRSRAENPS